MIANKNMSSSRTQGEKKVMRILQKKKEKIKT